MANEDQENQKIENLKAEIESINARLEEIADMVKKNLNYDAGSIERTQLQVRKNNLQKELRSLLQKDIENNETVKKESKQEEIKKNKKTYKNLTDEELKARYDELLQEYQFRAHEENGIEQHDDNLLGELQAIQKEMQVRKKEQKKESKVEIPGVGTSQNEISKGENPKEENPKEENPKGENPKEENPKEENPKEENPKKENSKEKISKVKDVKNKLTTRGFWRIVADTSYDGKQASSRAITLRNFARAKLFPPTRIKDGGIGWLGLPVTLITMPIKLGAKVANAIGNRATEEQYQDMCAKLRNLRDNSPDEWNVLLNGEAGPDGQNLYGLVHESTARQYKLNDLYLQAVMEVLSEDMQEKIATSDQNRAKNQEEEKKADNAMRQMRETVLERVGNKVKIDEKDFSEEHAKMLLTDKSSCVDPEKLAQIQMIEQELINAGIYNRDELENIQARYEQFRIYRNDHSTRDIVGESTAERKVVEQYKAVERASFNKSRNKDNYGPTFPLFKLFAVTNPDNRDMIEDMAEHHDAARIARTNGDEQSARDEEFEMKQTLERETSERHIGPITITRGKAKREKVTVISNDREDTRGRQLITNVALATAAVNLGMSFMQQKKISEAQAEINQQHSSHNSELDSINANNTQLEQNYQDALVQVQQYAQGAEPTEETYNAIKTIVSDNTQGILSRYHDGLTVGEYQVPGGEWNFVTDESAHAISDSINAQLQSVVQQAEHLVQSGNYQDACDLLVKFDASSVEPALTDAMQYQLGVLQQAVNGGSQYSSTYKEVINSTQEALNNRGNISDLLSQASSSVTVPSVNGIMQSANHIGDYVLSIPSTVVPTIATFGATVGNALFGSLVKKREEIRKRKEETDKQNEIDENRAKDDEIER